jgi:hypothetical protein
LTALSDEIPIPHREAPAPPQPPAQLEPAPHAELQNLIGPELQQEIPLDPELACSRASIIIAEARA